MFSGAENGGENANAQRQDGHARPIFTPRLACDFPSAGKASGKILEFPKATFSGSPDLNSAEGKANQCGASRAHSPLPKKKDFGNPVPPASESRQVQNSPGRCHSRRIFFLTIRTCNNLNLRFVDRLTINISVSSDISSSTFAASGTACP